MRRDRRRRRVPTVVGDKAMTMAQPKRHEFLRWQRIYLLWVGADDLGWICLLKDEPLLANVLIYAGDSCIE
jgi:hypothetical protein